MDKTKKEINRKLIVTLSICINLSLLFYFKYSNFFIDNFNHLLSVFGLKGLYWTKLILPIGISFYTFETITYVVDVYRKIHKPLKNFWDYQLYIILFPKLIAGPIVRYHEISDQITGRFETDNIDNKISGFFRFCIGLSKKVLIANTLAIKADEVFNLNVTDITTPMAWLGVLAYTFQIYFDFSGYSDMAIGIGKMLGFKFPENFNNPYVSKSITEFWRRWHMSLGNWLRSYIFTPLSLNLRNTPGNGMALSLIITFSLCGLWHGASWTFIIWGLYYGVLLVIERLFLLNIYKKIWGFLSIFITFFFVVIGWIFFRMEKIKSALIFIKKLFNFERMHSFGKVDTHLCVTGLIAIIFSFFIIIPYGNKIQQKIYFGKFSNIETVIFSIIFISLFFTCVAYISSGNLNPFIYFRF